MKQVVTGQAIVQTFNKRGTGASFGSVGGFSSLCLCPSFLGREQ